LNLSRQVTPLGAKLTRRIPSCFGFLLTVP
jgi:hypothetical protein